MGRQIALLLAACLSFSLLLAVHQFLFLLINAMVGGLPQWRVESLWSKLVNLVTESQNAAQNLDPNGAVDQLFGGNLPDSSGPFGITWGQVAGGLGSFETFVVSALVPIRFVAMFVAVISAPLAILCFSTTLTRRLFSIWLLFWAEIEGLAFGSAIVLAAYQQIHNKMGSVAPMEQAYILLGLCGLVCGANLVFLYKFIGQFLGNITSFYQQQYQRERQVVGVAAQAAVGIIGAIATALTGGAALPAAMAAEGLVSGATNLGATPGGAVPGAGVGNAFIGAGRAAATYQHQQAQEAERAASNLQAEDRHQATQARQQRQDADRTASNLQAEDRYQATQARQQRQDADRTVDRAIGKGYASQFPPRPDGGNQNGGNPGPRAGAPPGGWGGGRGGGNRGNAPFPSPVPQPPQYGPQAQNMRQPPPAQPPTVHQEVGALLRDAQIAWDVRRQILAALPPSTRGMTNVSDEGVRKVREYVEAVKSQPHLGREGYGSANLINELLKLARPTQGKGKTNV